MSSHVFLVRSGETKWRATDRLLGRRDIGLSEAGEAQAEHAIGLLGDVEVAEILTSPLERTMATAAHFAKRYSVEIARDRRLTALDVGKWEGATSKETSEADEFQSFLAGGATGFPDGEQFAQVRGRMTASVEQALDDNPGGANIVIVSHGGPLRVLLAHYLGIPLGQYHGLQLMHGGLSIVRFDADLAEAWVMGINVGQLVPTLLTSPLS